MCAAPCTGPDDTYSCVVDDGCDAVGECVLTIDPDNVCGYTCNTDLDCPTNMYCDGSLISVSICYPY
jgi:hypothetical protein